MNIFKKYINYYIFAFGITLSILVFITVSSAFNGLAIKRYEKIVFDYVQTVGQVIGKNLHTIKIIEIFSRKMESNKDKTNYEIFGEIVTDDNETLKEVMSALVDDKNKLKVVWATKDFLSYIPDDIFNNIEEDALRAVSIKKPMMSKPFKKEKDTTNFMVFIYPLLDNINEKRIIAGIFDFDGLLASVLNRHDIPAGLNIRIKDITNKENHVILSYHKSRLAKSGYLSPNFNDIFTANLEIGSRSWQFEFEPVVSLVSIFERVVSLFSAIIVGLMFLLLIKHLKIIQIQKLQNARLINLGEASAGLAHELNQPLNIIKLKAESILIEKEKNNFFDINHFEKNIKTIFEQSERMSNIIDHIMVFATKQDKIESVFLVNEAIKNALKIFKQLSRNDNIEIYDNIDTPLFYIKGNKVKLEQVIINILINARDAIKEKHKKKPFIGKIKIELYKSKNPKNDLNIKIEDNGIGLPKKFSKKVFSSFFSTKNTSKNMGLGLSICNDIITAMNGHIIAEKVDNGTVFIINLPKAVKEDNVINKNCNEEPVEPEKLHILLVDDEEEALTTISQSLEKEGIRVSSAVDAISAIKFFEEDPCDILITDIKLENINGFDLIKKLRIYNENLPVIAISGHFSFYELENLNNEYNSNPILFMAKPLSLKELITKVKSVWKEKYPCSYS